MSYINEFVDDDGLVSTSNISIVKDKIFLNEKEVTEVKELENYIHGIFSIKKDCFIHFDGALIFHTEDDRKLIEQGKIPPKKAKYNKLFLLNCDLEIDLAKEMMSKYLPIEELNQEFGITEKIW